MIEGVGVLCSLRSIRCIIISESVCVLLSASSSAAQQEASAAQTPTDRLSRSAAAPNRCGGTYLSTPHGPDAEQVT